MTNPHSLAGLTAEEQEDYESCLTVATKITIPSVKVMAEFRIRTYESLSRSRALLNISKEYLGNLEIRLSQDSTRVDTPLHNNLKKHITAIAAELAGTGE